MQTGRDDRDSTHRAPAELSEALKVQYCLSLVAVVRQRDQSMHCQQLYVSRICQQLSVCAAVVSSTSCVLELDAVWTGRVFSYNDSKKSAYNTAEPGHCSCLVCGLGAKLPLSCIWVAPHPSFKQKLDCTFSVGIVGSSAFALAECLAD